MRLASTCITVLASTLAWLGAGLGAGCDDASGTSGARVVIAAAVAPAEDPTAPFENGLGYAIRVERALLAVGALYVFEGGPVTARATPSPPPWGIPVAHAHPGHYASGDALGEVLVPLTVDLMVAETPLAPGEGITGLYRSGTIAFAAPPAGDLDAEIDGHVAFVEGEATGDDGTTWSFRVAADAADVTNDDGDLAVAGCPFDEVQVERDGRVVLAVSVREWLDRIDFADVPVPPPGSRVDLATVPVAQEAFTRGVRKASAYRFRWEAP